MTNPQEAHPMTVPDPSTTPGRDLAVRVERRFEASPERVYDAWLDPALLSRWMFGPDVREEEILHVRLDARPGGRYSFAVRREGELVDHIGTYLEMDRPRRLAFTWGIAGHSDDESRVRIDIEPDGAGCVLTLVHELDPKWADYADRTAEAWTLMLGKLDEVFSAEAEALPTGGYGQVPAPATLRFERRLPGPVERVWSYLTDSALRGEWLATGEMPLREGADFTLHFRHADLSPHPEAIPDRYREWADGAELRCRITRAEAPRLLAFLWDGDSEVTFELFPEGDDVRLVLTHRRLPDDMLSEAAGWHTHLDILVQRLHGRVPPPFWGRHLRHEEGYREAWRVDGGR
jgi:uncharacterized protein YndB with AHSA1/START domain